MLSLKIYIKPSAKDGTCYRNVMIVFSFIAFILYNEKGIAIIGDSG
ncbi:MAG: hypothetical protein ACYCPR_08965 [Thermoplasmataceae archaeon]